MDNAWNRVAAERCFLFHRPTKGLVLKDLSAVGIALGDAGHLHLLGPLGHGGTERVMVYTPILWHLVYGGALLGGMPTRSH